MTIASRSELAPTAPHATPCPSKKRRFPTCGNSPRLWRDCDEALGGLVDRMHNGPAPRTLRQGARGNCHRTARPLSAVRHIEHLVCDPHFERLMSAPPVTKAVMASGLLQQCLGITRGADRMMKGPGTQQYCKQLPGAASSIRRANGFGRATTRARRRLSRGCRRG